MLYLNKICVILYFVTFIIYEISGRNERPSKYGFEIDYKNNRFLLDGQPFRYVSGSFHYFRCPRQYWRDRLRKMRAAGLNAISTYVEWSLHEPEPNVWNWEGDADVVEFIKLAHEEGLFVLLRPGPYICAERDLGGLPYWLLSLVPDINLRTNDNRYMRFVEIYLNKILSKTQPLLRGNGGPIIMVQVENEYGSFNACDKGYMNKLREIINQYVAEKAVLYTTDGVSDTMLKCGSVPGAYATIDFGTRTNVSTAFNTMRRFESKGPLVNSEFYPGWLTHWEEPLQTVPSNAVTKTLYEMLLFGASVNIYMFYGGSNFGFTSGANGNREQFQPQITSYDYDAPLTEAGDITPKYHEIRNVIAKFIPLPNISIPENIPKGNYGIVQLQPVLELFNPLARTLFGRPIIQSDYPPTFETMKLPSYLVLYEAKLPANRTHPSLLEATVADRAIVYLDYHISGILSRSQKIYSMPLYNPVAESIQILLENQGHLNFGNLIADFKGISNVTVGNKAMKPWNITGFQLNDISYLTNISATSQYKGVLYKGPLFLQGTFMVEGEPQDTFLDTSDWAKGVAYINDHNLGRYWPVAGPQLTLYVPAMFLKTGQNKLTILELEYVPNMMRMKLQNKPLLGTKDVKFMNN